jgi:phage terminase large subunit-like protein
MNFTIRDHLKTILLNELQRRQSIDKRYNWIEYARPEQKVPEGNWRIWLILAGRGFGKTRTGAETIRQWVDSGKYRRIALIGDNILNAQQIMIEGVSGLLQCYPPGKGPIYERSKQRLRWSNGAVAQLYAAESYENLRGPQFDAAWIDELAKFRTAEATWDQLMLSLRLGKSPKCIITTTPRPLPLLEALLQRSDVMVTRGSTFDNSENLAKEFINLMKDHYAKTHLAAQELYGHILTDHQGALWKRSMIHYQIPTATHQ